MNADTQALLILLVVNMALSALLAAWIGKRAPGWPDLRVALVAAMPLAVPLALMSGSLLLLASLSDDARCGGDCGKSVHSAAIMLLWSIGAYVAGVLAGWWMRRRQAG